MPVMPLFSLGFLEVVTTTPELSPARP
jgi:hypothetical protein